MKNGELRAKTERAQQICTAHAITQSQIASDLGASQSQVSRILMGKGMRSSRLAEELWLYLEKYQGGVTTDLVKKNGDLMEALATTWDGTAVHARALASVIRSLSALGPSIAGQSGETK
jgi:transcriptional regulator with XRE-family HTH domain